MPPHSSLQSQLLIGGNKLEDIPAFRTLLARVSAAAQPAAATPAARHDCVTLQVICNIWHHTQHHTQELPAAARPGLQPTQRPG